MTDAPYPATTILGHGFPLPSLQQNGQSPEHRPYAGPVMEMAQEDDGQISCMCGYYDDDGWTVQCDRCNRWQHQICYYPEYEDRSLPEDLQHYCVECEPRVLDHDGARVRQRIKREEQASEINGIKRQAPKSHKKKIKEPGYTNGWPLDPVRHDRNSASPRDQAPPAKRAKTSHRPSESIATNASNKGHSRKRNVSSANHRRSLSSSPETPIDLYSDHFVRCYENDDWVFAESNLHTSTDVSNALSAWLQAPDEEFQKTHSWPKSEVLWRYDGDLEGMTNKAELEIREERDDRVRDADGNCPTWKWITVKEPIAENAYIGELKGYVGFRDEYIMDPSNRWPSIRHPEPFVFFHSKLPIYIDARNEGTRLRYVRRSCMPNAKLQVLVTDSRDYRFCFIATRQIDPGMEIAVPWTTFDSVPSAYNRDQMDPETMRKMHVWVSNLLANCGPCACHLPDQECWMARLDRRATQDKNDHDLQSIKAPKPRKKKDGRHISPLNTNLTSRSGSEARKGELDDERSVSRSASDSAGQNSPSRDITPTALHSHAIPELSQRERKKLAKEEAMFKRQEEEQSGVKSKKKRSSGASSANTPNATSSKQLGFGSASKYADAGISRQAGLPSAKPGRRPKSSGAQTSPGSRPSSSRRPRPEYVDSEIQCTLEEEELVKSEPTSPPRRPFLSTTQRLLQRCALNNARRKGPAALAEAERLIHGSDKMDVDQHTIPNDTSDNAPSRIDVLPNQAETAPRQASSDDTEMKDATTDHPISAPPDAAMSDAYGDPSSLQSQAISNQAAKPPAPPWPLQTTQPTQDLPQPSLHAHKPIDMHLQMPPPPSNPFAAAPASATAPSSALSVSGTPNSAATMVQSPASTTGSATNPMFSPSVNAAVNPSPAKKKLSLSDYTRRNKAKDKETPSEVKSERESSPASTSGSAAAVPPLLASSSDVARAVAEEGASAIVEEEEGVADGGDVKMEDAGDSNAATMTTATATSS